MPSAYIVLLKNLLKHIRGRLLSSDIETFFTDTYNEFYKN